MPGRLRTHFLFESLGNSSQAAKYCSLHIVQTPVSLQLMFVARHRVVFSYRIRDFRAIHYAEASLCPRPAR